MGEEEEKKEGINESEPSDEPNTESSDDEKPDESQDAEDSDAEKKVEEQIEGSAGEQDSLFEDKKDEVSHVEPEKNVDNKDVDKIQDKQLKWAVFLMVSIILIIVIVPFVNTNFVNKFDYHGLTFQKTQLGEIEFYSTKFPVVVGTGEVIGDYAVNLRNDPRELEDIEVRATYGTIDFRYYKNVDGGIAYYPVYVSLDPEMEICDDSALAMITLSGFLGDSGLEVRSASMSEEYALENNVPYKRCEDDSTVILITQGNVNKITEIGTLCYEIRFKECDILKVTERFVLNILEQYGERFTVKNG
jgi:hypothetical protein